MRPLVLRIGVELLHGHIRVLPCVEECVDEICSCLLFSADHFSSSESKQAATNLQYSP